MTALPAGSARRDQDGITGGRRLASACRTAAATTPGGVKEATTAMLVGCDAEVPGAAETE